MTEDGSENEYGFGDEEDDDQDEENEEYRREEYILGIAEWLKNKYPFWNPSQDFLERHGDIMYRYSLRSGLTEEGKDTEETIFNSLDGMFMRMIVNEFGTANIIKTMCDATGKDPCFFLNKMFAFAAGYLEQCLLIMPME